MGHFLPRLHLAQLYNLSDPFIYRKLVGMCRLKWSTQLVLKQTNIIRHVLFYLESGMDRCIYAICYTA